MRAWRSGTRSGSRSASWRVEDGDGVAVRPGLEGGVAGARHALAGQAALLLSHGRVDPRPGRPGVPRRWLRRPGLLVRGRCLCLLGHGLEPPEDGMAVDRAYAKVPFDSRPIVERVQVPMAFVVAAGCSRSMSSPCSRGDPARRERPRRRFGAIRHRGCVRGVSLRRLRPRSPWRRGRRQAPPRQPLPR